MEFNRCERAETATMLSRLENILRDGRQIGSAASNATYIRIRPTMPLPLKAAWARVAVLSSRAECKDTFLDL